MAKFNQVPLAASRPERFRNRIDIWQPSSLPSTFPPYVRSLNPWLYWQLNDDSHAAGATAADSASRCQTTPNNASWGGPAGGCTGPNIGSGVPQPPPNPGTYGANLVIGDHLTGDGRVTVKTAGPGAIASVGWPYFADPPLCGTGATAWIATHFKFSAFAAPLGDSDWMWLLPCNGNTQMFCDLATNGINDRIEVVSTNFDGSSFAQDWLLPVGTIGTAKSHELITRMGTVTYDGTDYHSIWTVWLDGINLGDKDTNFDNQSTGQRASNEGVQLGANLHAGDSYSVQDLVIMGSCGQNAVATDMTDGLATGFFAQWRAAGGGT